MPDRRPPPRLRWTSEPVERPPIFVVPGESVGASSVVQRGKTWGIRERGDTHKLVPHSYRCPVHGVFELRVPLSDVPDEAFCTVDVESAYNPGDHRENEYCGLTSPWAGSTCAIGIEPGMVTG
jgi:hypothetical protein